MVAAKPMTDMEAAALAAALLGQGGALWREILLEEIDAASAHVGRHHFIERDAEAAKQAAIASFAKVRAAIEPADRPLQLEETAMIDAMTPAQEAAVRDFDPAKGMAFQGDVAIIPVPEGVAISTVDEVAPVAGRLILQEGEVTGHHHAVVLERPTDHAAKSVAVASLMADALAGRIAVPTAKLYRDANAAREMMRAGVMTRSDLCVAFLVIEHGPMVVSHEEHDGIRLPVGRYYIGRQVESAGAEERIVAD